MKNKQESKHSLKKRLMMLKKNSRMRLSGSGKKRRRLTRQRMNKTQRRPLLIQRLVRRHLHLKVKEVRMRTSLTLMFQS